MTHYDLCRITAEWAIKKTAIAVVLWEYQAMWAEEHPDCLVFGPVNTKLFEIKTSRSDFRVDSAKDCRQINKTRIKQIYQWEFLKEKYHRRIKLAGFDGSAINFIKKFYPGNFIVESFERAQLGNRRYYVCSAGLINPDEVGYWGLYWYKNDRFYLKKESAKFKRNIMAEQYLLVHALKKLKEEPEKENIIVA